MHNLPYDIGRCYGSQCKERNSCKRFLTIASDKLITEPVRLSYTDNMWHDGGVSCKSKLEVV